MEKNKVFLLISGIILPLMAVIIPIIDKHLSNFEELEYQWHSLVKVQDNRAFRLIIHNNSSDPQTNVKISFPTIVNKKSVVIDYKKEIRSINNNGNFTIINIGDLKAFERASISFLVTDPLFFVLDEYMKSTPIESDRILARLHTPPKSWEKNYRIGFIVCSIIIMLLWIFFWIQGKNPNIARKP